MIAVITNLKLFTPEIYNMAVRISVDRWSAVDAAAMALLHTVFSISAQAPEQTALCNTV